MNSRVFASVKRRRLIPPVIALGGLVLEAPVEETSHETTKTAIQRDDIVC
jgi:hypothetical protein